MVEEDTWKKEGNLGNAQEAIKDYKKGYEETARRITEKEDGTYCRSKLPRRYMAKILYRWDDRRFKREYLKKLEGDWRQWKGGKFFWRKNLKRGSTVMNALDPIKELYDLYSDEEDTPRIIEILDRELDMGNKCYDSKSNPRLLLAFKGLLNNLRDYNASQSINSTGQVTILCKQCRTF